MGVARSTPPSPDDTLRRDGLPGSSRYILIADQGSRSSRALLFNERGRIVAKARSPLRAFLPRQDWVEHNPEELLSGQLSTIRAVLSRVDKNKIVSLGIANQRSTFLLWEKSTGKPLSPAISWQDRRGREVIERVASYDETIRKKTGLLLTPFYSASKICWALDEIPGARTKAKEGKLLFGTVNTYLIWHLTRGKVHATDYTNAARTLLFNLSTLAWDEELLSLFQIPRSILPEVYPTEHNFGEAYLERTRIPILISIGDQQASAVGLGCVREGEMALNLGTGGFLLMNTGRRPLFLPGLLTSILFSSGEGIEYLLEGTVNAVGSVFEWMKTIGVLRNMQEINALCHRSKERVSFIPALGGLGAPHWDQGIRTTLLGASRTTRREDIVRGAVEGIAFLIKDIYEEMKKAPIASGEISVGGGGSRITYLVQFLADILQKEISRSPIVEATAYGAAYLLGRTSGFWSNPVEMGVGSGARFFHQKIGKEEAASLYRAWQTALHITQDWGRHSP